LGNFKLRNGKTLDCGIEKKEIAELRNFELRNGKPMTPQELKDRTKAFAIWIVKMFRSLPKETDAQVIGKQALRSGTSVGANYRAACRARSHAEFLAKLGVVVEEADETVYWLELLRETQAIKSGRLDPLMNEAQQLTAIFTVAKETARQNRN
jgi:four helix bundle protein